MPPQYQQIKLVLDVHAASIVVVRMVGGAKPQPPQSFKLAVFLEWARKQKALAQEVVSCHEAGPTGFSLHRQLTTLGIRNCVVCPTCLDERHGGVNNDRTDALELATRLDRYLAGNDRALAVVGVRESRHVGKPGPGPQPHPPAGAARKQSLVARAPVGAFGADAGCQPVERLQVFRELILKVDGGGERLFQLGRAVGCQNK
jgi:hypothetical protein